MPAYLYQLILKNLTDEFQTVSELYLKIGYFKIKCANQSLRQYLNQLAKEGTIDKGRKKSFVAFRRKLNEKGSG